jgi:hypothetical protein
MATKKQKTDGQKPLPGIPADLEKNQTGRPKGMPSLEMIKTATARYGLPDSDAEYMYDSWLMSGFRTARGQKIQDWQAAVRNWVRSGYFPSLKRANKFNERDREAEELLRIRRAKQRAEEDRK